MLNIKKDLSALTIISALSIMALPVASNAQATQQSSDKLLERPSWLPELPKINTEGFAPDSTVYIGVRKRILEGRDKSAIKDLESLAKRGHAASMVMVGYLLDQEPKLIKTDSKKAAQYWQIAAKAGDAVALYNLGILYMNGRGVPKNLDTAQKLFEIAADRGMYRAEYLIGQLNELNVEYLPAIENYRKCLNVRYLVQCKTRYGILSVTKVRLKPNEAKQVINLLAAASREGDLEATYTLARLAAEGIVLNKSMPTMVYYLEGMVKAPNTTNAYRELAKKMYRAYNPSEDDIKKGKDNYRIANAGGVGTIVYRYIDTTKPVLDAGNIIE